MEIYNIHSVHKIIIKHAPQIFKKCYDFQDVHGDS